MTRSVDSTVESSTNRGVSDVIGFALMFGIIITGVGIVSVAGVTDIIEFGDQEEVATSERGMEAAASTLDKLNRQGDWNRSFDLVIGTGNIWMNETYISVDGPPELTDQIGNSSGTVQVNSLEHRFQRQPEVVSVGYEAGGVYRSNSGSAAYQPSVMCDTDTNTAIVTLLNLTSADADINVAVDYDRQFRLDPTDLPEESPVAAFAASVKIQADLVNVTSYTTQSAGTDITMDVSSASFPEPWGAELQDAGWSDVGNHQYQCSADTVVIRVTTVSIRRLL